MNPPVKGRKRCRLHGGAIGAGTRWHETLPVAGDSPSAEAKQARKDARRAVLDARLAERFAAMTPEQRAAYDHWHEAHRPGSPRARARRRSEAQQAEHLRELLARPDPPAPDGDREMVALLAELRAAIAAHEAEDAARGRYNEGVFG